MSRNAKIEEPKTRVARWRLGGLIEKLGGQAAVEFALVLSVAMIVLFVAIQLALIGEAALSLGQMNYQGARFAAVETCATGSDVASYMYYIGSPTVTTPSSCGSALTIKIADSTNGNTLTTYTGATSACGASSQPSYTPSGCTTPRTFGTQVTVNVTFNVTKGNILFLGQSFFGVSFKSLQTLSSTETAMAE
jgi:Flp pilus assembly protein TadG